MVIIVVVIVMVVLVVVVVSIIVIIIIIIIIIEVVLVVVSVIEAVLITLHVVYLFTYFINSLPLNVSPSVPFCGVLYYTIKPLTCTYTQHTRSGPVDGSDTCFKMLSLTGAR